MTGPAKLNPSLLPPESKKPDFDNFLRAITTREPGPVPVGDLFADAETMGALLEGNIRRFRSAENMDEGMKILEKTVQFCVRAAHSRPDQQTVTRKFTVKCFQPFGRYMGI